MEYIEKLKFNTHVVDCQAYQGLREERNLRKDRDITTFFRAHGVNRQENIQ